jgi:hypothetical protein
MPRKLKVYQTSQGFYDLAIAAPSMKAALKFGVDAEMRSLESIAEPLSASEPSQGLPAARSGRERPPADRAAANAADNWGQWSPNGEEHSSCRSIADQFGCVTGCAM